MLVTTKIQKQHMMDSLRAASLLPLTPDEEASMDQFLAANGDKEVQDDQVIYYLDGIEMAAVQYCLRLRRPVNECKDFGTW